MSARTSTRRAAKSARPKSKSSKNSVPPFVDLMLGHLQKEETNIPALLRANFTQEEDDVCMHTTLKKEGILGLLMSCQFSGYVGMGLAGVHPQVHWQHPPATSYAVHKL